MIKLATHFVRFWKGGKSNKNDITIKDVNPSELAMGINVEYEHGPDKITSRKIALDHLAEIPDYYTRLKKMEEEVGVS